MYLRPFRLNPHKNQLVVAAKKYIIFFMPSSPHLKRAQHRKKKGSDSEETKTSPRKSPKSSRKGGNDKDKDNEMTEKTKEKEEDSKKSMTLASFVVKFGGHPSSFLPSAFLLPSCLIPGQCAAAAILEANGIVHIVEGNGKKK